MATAYPFVVPSLLPQDLQIIQDIVGQLPPDPVAQKVVEPALSDHDHGTDSETDSEQEVEDGILGDIAEEGSERYVTQSLYVSFTPCLLGFFLSLPAIRTLRATPTPTLILSATNHVDSGDRNQSV